MDMVLKFFQPQARNSWSQIPQASSSWSPTNGHNRGPSPPLAQMMPGSPLQSPAGISLTHWVQQENDGNTETRNSVASPSRPIKLACKEPYVKFGGTVIAGRGYCNLECHQYFMRTPEDELRAHGWPFQDSAMCYACGCDLTLREGLLSGQCDHERVSGQSPAGISLTHSVQQENEGNTETRNFVASPSRPVKLACKDWFSRTLSGSNEAQPSINSLIKLTPMTSGQPASRPRMMMVWKKFTLPCKQTKRSTMPNL